MTFKEIFKNPFMEQFQTGNIGMGAIIIAVLFSVITALYVFFLYRFFVRKSMYNMNMNLSIVGMTILTTAIILTIQSNIVLSLGMVGALSIVRYRTAVKDPMDLFFMFWAIANGIICGARQFVLGIIVTIVVTVILFVLSQFPSTKAPYVLVVNGKNIGVEKEIIAVLEENECYYKVKSRNILKNNCRFIVEVNVKDAGSLLDSIVKVENVTDISLLTYEGDIVA